MFPCIGKHQLCFPAVWYMRSTCEDVLHMLGVGYGVELLSVHVCAPQQEKEPTVGACVPMYVLLTSCVAGCRNWQWENRGMC